METPMEATASDAATSSAPPVEETDEMRLEKMIKFMEGDAHMAKIKHEYINIHYKARLDTKYLPESVKKELQQQEAGADGQPPKKKAKFTGRNKKRPHNKFNDRKICSFVAAGRECPFGDKCRFPHDVEKYMADKPPDIRPTCYVFEKLGKCPQGLQCRFAGQHLTEDFKNIVDDEKVKESKSQTVNILPKDLQYHLRRREIFFPNADKYLESIGIKPNRAYRSKEGKPNQKTSAATDGETLKQNPTVSNNDTDENGMNPSSGVVDPKLTSAESLEKQDVVPPGGDLEKQVEASSVGDDVEKATGVVVRANSVAVDNIDSHLNDGKSAGCLTDEDVIKIKPGEKKTIDFRDKLYLAPLTTVGNLPFRRICKNYGVDITCGEMALSTNILQGQQSEWALLKRHSSEDLFGVQLCGGHADTMTRCAELLNRTLDLDFIDVNVGCPIDLIFKKGEGSALMGRMTKFEQIVRGMTSVLDIPLTVKIRTGIYDNKSIAHTVVPKLRDWGASLVTLHGRSREQRYTKPADWDYIAECAELARPMPFFGNGDILSYEEYHAKKQSTGVAGIMIARGALIKPWIFTEIKEKRIWDISSSERFDMLKDFSNYGLEHWGSDTQGVETVRRFLLEWLSFLHRYIPVGVLEQVPQKINHRPPRYLGRNDLETLMASENCGDWVKISEMLLGPVHDDFTFLPKHKANSYR
ncbi:tRNA-dihydrouridine(47) synthase [NAD(P)(+)]-like isoform X2 [Lineus longissimus]